MAFISTEMENMLKKMDLDEEDEEYCLGCETGVDYIGAHLDRSGKYHKECCTFQAEKSRRELMIQKK